MSEEEVIVDEPLDAVAVASRLTSALNALTAALRKLRRRQRAIIVAFVLLAALFLYQAVTRYDARISACDRDNDVRSGLLNVADTLEAGAERPITPEAQAFLADMRRDFALRDCSNIPWL